jgi:hypothetical protein
MARRRDGAMTNLGTILLPEIFAPSRLRAIAIVASIAP